MTAKYFVDTNILLYAVSKTPSESAKTAVAREILGRNDIGISVQVLQEFYVQATRAKPDALTHQQATNLVESWLRFPVQLISVQILVAALSTKDRFMISYWDAAIIEAAREMGCKNVVSEDLADGRNYNGVIVVNPFVRALV